MQLNHSYRNNREVTYKAESTTPDHPFDAGRPNKREHRKCVWLGADHAQAQVPKQDMIGAGSTAGALNTSCMTGRRESAT
jgi:hypothetical protein